VLRDRRAAHIEPLSDLSYETAPPKAQAFEHPTAGGIPKGVQSSDRRSSLSTISHMGPGLQPASVEHAFRLSTKGLEKVGTIAFGNARGRT